jgi:hypothetical protein
MNSPTAQTALFGLIAGVVSLVAAWYYPWPENVAQSDLLGKPLFETFEAKDVRTITVTEYDPDRNGLKQIQLRRSGEFWVIPSRQNFVANNPMQISQAINSVNTNVLEQRANDLQDHVEYGVVDPMEFESTPARNSLGKKIVLQDRNNQELASLIVGGAPRDDANVNQTRRFVRIAGKPGVYVVELPEQALTTDFSRWVSSNLFEIEDGSDLESLKISSYWTEKNQLSMAEPKKNWRYQLELDAKNQKQTMRVPNAQGEWVETAITTDQSNAIGQLGMYLPNIMFSNVRKKQRAVAELLRNPQAELAEVLERLQGSGFSAVRRAPDRKFGLEFQSAGGEISLQNSSGVSISLLVGDLVEAQPGETIDLSRLVMLYASFDPAHFPSPEKPATEGDDAQRAYLRQVADRDAKIKAAENRAQLLNNYYSDWFFVVPEQVINGLIPEFRLETPPPAEQAESANQAAAPESTDPQAESKGDQPEETPDSNGGG